MNDTCNFDVEHNPKILFRSSAFVLDRRGGGTESGDLTLHEQTHPVVLDVNRVDASHFTGSTMVRQAAFGINPIRLAGGAVTVKDDVKEVFEVFFRGK